jgi:hypothetical protein
VLGSDEPAFAVECVPVGVLARFTECRQAFRLTLFLQFISRDVAENKIASRRGIPDRTFHKIQVAGQFLHFRILETIFLNSASLSALKSAAGRETRPAQDK